jgi:hypothetical protein
MGACSDLHGDFRARIERFRVGSGRVGSGIFHMNAALSEGAAEIHRRTTTAHTWAPDRAFADARLTGMSRAPIVEC